MAELKSKKMKTHENGMFIALKYGAAAMAGATAYRLYIKQNGKQDPNSIALDEATRRFQHTGGWNGAREG